MDKFYCYVINAIRTSNKNYYYKKKNPHKYTLKMLLYIKKN